MYGDGRSEQLLAAVGIRSADGLRRRGAVDAYLALRRAGATRSLNMLWAMAGALDPWPDTLALFFNAARWLREIGDVEPHGWMHRLTTDPQRRLAARNSATPPTPRARCASCTASRPCA